MRTGVRLALCCVQQQPLAIFEDKVLSPDSPVVLAAGLSSGLNLLQGFDGRMEAKLLREKLLIRGRVRLSR